MATAVVVAGFTLLMQSQLEGIPREGVLFPMCVIWMLLGCSLLLAVRAVLGGRGELSFFDGIPPRRWCLVIMIFAMQVAGSMYLSFKMFMALGMFATLCVLTPVRSGRALAFSAVFTVCFVLFFQIFFTNIMNIYFPETLFE